MRELQRRLLEDTFGMAQGLEALVSVICAHTARTDAAKRKIVLSAVQNRFSERNASRGRAFEHEPASGTIRTKEVESQRSGPRVDVGDRIFELAIGESRTCKASPA